VNFFKRTLFLFGRAILRALFRVEVRGIENYRAAGSKVLVLPNHTSLLDAALAALFIPGDPVFAINTFVANDWRWVKPFLSLIRTWKVDPTNPFALKGLAAEISRGACCVFFPEGRISTTGGVMKIYDGAAMLADKSGAELVPLRIDGALFSRASYMRGKYPLRLFPGITMTFLPPRRLEAPESRGRKRREFIRIALHDLMRDASFSTLDSRTNLWDAVLRARKLYGRHWQVAEDTRRKPADYDAVVTASLALGSRLKSFAESGEYVGVLLPGSIPAVATVLGLSRLGRVPAMLNYTSGPKNVLACCASAQIRTVVTSRRFVSEGKFGHIVEALEKSGVKVLWLEDVSSGITATGKLFAWAQAKFSTPRCASAPDDPAVALFTSGSEGAPKGVVLSHANVVANRNQLISSIDFNPGDIVMNAMPMFHMFGFVVGTLMPLLTGIKTFYYPNPLHYKIIPLLSYDINATVLFGTDTFLNAYARNAHPYDFYSVRYVFAGAEKLRERTRAMWAEKFGIRVIEGYGATETSIISANTPMQFKSGTVGRVMPGVKRRVEPVPGIERGGRFFVSGPNVMKGYLRLDAPGVIQPPEGGWYDTGDIIDEDERGFLTIMGRAKRFAKIGGEMISLSALEEEVDRLWPGRRHAVASVIDDRKGESLVLVTEHWDAARDELAAFLKDAGYSEMFVPKKITRVDAIPLLGSGKTDYPALDRMLSGEAK
jgi:acyl-[acyl-carrier-protein]-phospholipid O-acyltransferase/long-chain-fatty-acid--[acyl-carrier-protein] ligase